jgi:2-oxoglutarate ferredoxin oxidoreductase subunit gamma
LKKTKISELQILLAGFGGQGIIFMGKMLAQLALLKGKNVTWMPSYGAEVRGGTAHSMIVISTREIASPYVSEPDICVVMNNPSLKRFTKDVKKGGTLVINSSLCQDRVGRKDIKIIKIPATHIATKIGDIKVANMVLLGALTKLLGIFDLKDTMGAFNNLIPLHRKNLIPQNEKAFMKGASLIDGKSKS